MQSNNSMLALLLTEAIESNTDQILMISRSDQANIYFVSKGYAKRKLPFEQRYVNALIDQIRQLESPVFWGRHAGEHFSVKYQILDAPPGECLLMMIQPV